MYAGTAYATVGYAAPGTVAPTNDSPTTAPTVGDTTITTDTSGATTDPLEPTAGGTESAWYSITASSTDPLLIDATESNYATSVAVYEGTLDTTVSGYNLTLVASGDGSATFKPVANKTYIVKVGSKTSGTTGTQKVKKALSLIFGRWGIPI